jgi:hypothetical protein
MKLEIEVRRIDQQEAGRLIGTNDNPRGKHPPGRIAAYARLMTDCFWKLSVIILDAKGKLLDGFGRMAAVQLCGKSQVFAVITGWPVNDVDVIDGNKVRDSSSLLRNNGVASPHRVRSLIAGIVRLPHHQSTPVVLLNSDYLPLYARLEPVITPLTPFLVGGQGSLPTCCLTAFARAILAGESSSRIVEALRKMTDLIFGSQDEPLRLLVKTLQQETLGSGGTIGQGHVYMKSAKALRAWLSGEGVKLLKVGGVDPFPSNIMP